MKETIKSDELIIEKLNDSIKKYLRVALIFFTMSAVAFVWALIGVFLIFVDSIPQTNSVWTYISFCLGYITIELCSLITVITLKAKKEINFEVDSTNFVLFLTLRLFLWLILSLLIAFTDSTSAFFIGVFSGCSGAFNVLGYIFVFVSFCTVIKKYKVKYADCNRIEKENQRQFAMRKAEERRLEKEVNTVLNLLSKVGNKFFVKYYDELKNWAEPDILDVIQEDYSEETKLQRIRKAKEIFNKKLEKLALQIIADDTNKTVDEETKQKAKELLVRIK